MNISNLDTDIAFRFAIFKDNRRFNWENHLQYAHSQTMHSQSYTTRWIDALTFLRRELGESFLWQLKYTHPLASLIIEASPFQIERLIHFAEVLLHLHDSDPNYTHFRQKLISPSAAKDESMDILRIGHLLRSARMGLRFPAEIKNQKNPDAIFTDPDTHQVVFGEVSRMDEPEQRHAYDHNYRQLHYTLERNLSNPLYSAIQLKLTSEEYPTELAPHLVALQQEVIRTNSWAEYNDPNFSIRLFPMSQMEALYTWLNAVNRRKGFHGPPLDFDETRRISGNKIARKAKQLPEDGAGILFIPVTPLHFWQQHVTSTTQNLQTRMEELPHVFGVYLFSEALHDEANKFRFTKDDGFDRISIAGALTRYSLFIPNEAFDRPLNPHTRQKLLTILAPSDTKSARE